MSSLLSWDDFEEEEVSVVKTAVNQEAALKAAESIKNLDATPGIKEMEEQEAAFKRSRELQASGMSSAENSNHPLMNPGATYTVEQMDAIHSDKLARAAQIIQTMDAQLESGGRVGVDDKYLLNCQADLNQLVPFKYNWAWSLYLSSCENHWMPQELQLDRSAASLKTLLKTTPYKMLSLYFFNLLHRKRDFDNQLMLNIYRMSTNPECRQYILRLGFENSILDHVHVDLEDHFDIMKLRGNGGELIAQEEWNKTREVYRARSELIHAKTKFTRSLDAETSTPEKVGIFLADLAYLFGYTNWTANIVNAYHLLQTLRREGKAEELQMLVTRQLKDIQYQTSFITLFLDIAFEENAACFTDELKESIADSFVEMYALEVSLAKSINDDFQDACDLVKHFMNTFQSAIGIDSKLGNVKLNDDNRWFAELVEKLQPHINHEAGLSGNGGALDW